MEVLYKSPNYNPDKITNRYLHIQFWDGKVVINETVKTQKTNYTYRSYVLPETEYPQYSDYIHAAKKIQHFWPSEVELPKTL